LLKHKNYNSFKPKFLKNISINLSINPDTIPTLIPGKTLKAIQVDDNKPFYITEEIKDITKLANGVEYSPEFWESYLSVLGERPIPGSKFGHMSPYSIATPTNDFYTVGGKIEGKKVYLKLYIPENGFESSNAGFIRDVNAGLVHFSIVAWTEDIIERDENGFIKSIKAIKSVKGERNDAVEVNMGAMEMKVNKIAFDKLNDSGNDHSVIINDPNDFIKNSFLIKKAKNKGISIIYGKLKNKNDLTVQSYRFSAKLYTINDVKNELKKQNIKYKLINQAQNEINKTKEVYVMDENVYSDIIKNLKNQMDNGSVNKKQIAKDLGIEITEDRHSNALATIEKLKGILGNGDIIETIERMQADKKIVELDKYNIMRNKALSDTFGPADEENLKRAAAEPHISKEIIDEKTLKEQIEKVKNDPVVKSLSFQQADVNSHINSITGIKEENVVNRPETILIGGK
jgi:hypothetical protein